MLTGEPDLDVLDSIPLVSPTLLEACESRLRSLPGVRECAVLESLWASQDPPIHLQSLLPREMLVAPRDGALSSPSESSVSQERRMLPLAMVDGGAAVPSSDRSLSAVLARAARSSRPDDLTFVGPDGTIVQKSLRQLLETAQCILAGMRAAGFPAGRPVMLQLEANADILAAFWACVLGNYPPVIQPVPVSYADSSRSLDQLSHLVDTLEQPWVIAVRKNVDKIASWLELQGIARGSVIAFEELNDHAPDDRIDAVDPGEIAFFSTSSGSTGRPKCIQLTHGGLIDRAHGTNQLCGHSPEDVILNWLPLDHIGSISDWHIRCVLLGCRMVYVPMEYVIGQPLRWLDVLHQFRITHSWAPNFAFSLIRDVLSKQGTPTADSPWDLSCVQGLLTAGETVSPKVVNEFVALLKLYGFPETAIRPAFGMAELGSGVTYYIPTVERPLRFHTLARSSLESELVRVRPEHAEAVTFTDLGPPIPGITIRVVDEEDRLLREETVGRVQIRGSAVMTGYYRNPEANAVLREGWFDTGDLGFLTDGRLVLTGRAKDVIIINGVNYQSGEIEEAAEAVAGVEPACTVACAARQPNGEREELVLFFVTAITDGEELAKLVGKIRQSVVRNIGVKPDHILPVDQRQIAKTAIGKRQRSQLAQQFELGAFDELAQSLDVLTRNERTLPNWFFRRVWQPAQFPQQPLQPPASVALFGSGTVIEYLSERLRGLGIRVVRVISGASNSELAPDYFQINPLQPDDIALLLESFLWNNLVIDEWILGDAAALEMDDSSARDSAELADCQRTLLENLVRALTSGLQGDHAPGVTQLLRGAEAVRPEDGSTAIEAACTLGLLRSLSREHVGLSCRALDFGCDDSPDQVAEAVVRELGARLGEREVAFRQGCRFVPRLSRAEFQSSPTSVLKPRGVYGILGTRTPYRDALSTFLVEQLQAEVTAVESPADLWNSDGSDSEHGHRLDGLFYLPAFSTDVADAIEAATRLTAEIDMVHRQLEDHPECLLVTLASIKTLWGETRGCPALAKLDALNAHRRLRGSAVSLWAEMADERALLSAGTGLSSVDPAACLRSVLGALAHGADDWVIGLDGQHASIRRWTIDGPVAWERPAAFYTAEDSFAPQQLEDVEWPTDPFGRPLGLSFVRLDQLPKTGDEIDRDRLRRGMTQPARGRTQPSTDVEQHVAAMFCEVLGLSEVGLNDNFFELGGHSVLLLQLHARLQERFGAKLQLVDLFQYPSVAALAKALGGGQSVEAAAGQLQGRNRAAIRKQLGGERTTGSESGIAVIGMACRFPGADSVEKFWENLRNGVESITFFSEADVLAAGVDPDRVQDPRFVKAAPVLSAVEEFDAEFFGYTPREARLMDPQQRLFLECAWEAMEDAGYNPRTCPQSVGVFAGAVMNTYFANHVVPSRSFVDPHDRSEVFTLDSMSGFLTMVANDKDYLPTRVSYKLNLRGPSVNVQTACSTSLVAIHLAARAVANGDCDLALAGGVSVKVPQDTGYLYQSDVIVSPDGHCRAFDAQAEGTIFGNGCGTVLLKRLSDALADGDQIYAVIRGSGFNNDGGTKLGYMAPSQEGQAAVVAEALAMADVAPESIRFIEAHGTGTALGDPIEIAGLAQGLGSQERGFCAVGSVKTNLGHLQIASGVAGFMKAALAVAHAEIPPTLHFQSPNPSIGFEQTPFFVNNRLLPWPDSADPRRAGVNSLGIGGANCHIILEQAPVAAPRADAAIRPRHLLQLSAASAEALRDQVSRYLDWLERHPEAEIADVCFTANAGRVPLKHRLVIAAANLSELRDSLQARLDHQDIPLGASVAAGAAWRVAFLFAGTGSVSPATIRGLYETQPTFRHTIDDCAGIADPLLSRSLLSILLDSADESIYPPLETEIALFALKYSLTQMWQSWGVRPSVLMGYGLGEYVAACVAGVWSLADSFRIVAARSRLMQSLSEGCRAAVASIGEQELAGRLAAGGRRVRIAAINTPRQVVVAGESKELESFLESLRLGGIAVDACDPALASPPGRCRNVWRRSFVRC